MKYISKGLLTAMVPIIAFLICGCSTTTPAPDAKTDSGPPADAKIYSAPVRETKIDLNAFIQETQKQVLDANQMTFVWWVSREFWRISDANSPHPNPVQIEQFVKMLEPYLLMVVIAGKVGPMGGITYKHETTIRNNILIMDDLGTRYRPFDAGGIDADTKNLISILKPVMSNILGPLGQNMHAFLFPSKNDKGERIADPMREGSFSLKLGEVLVKWRTPLGSLLPPKICPVDGEKLSGAWKYCPWHGVALK